LPKWGQTDAVFQLFVFQINTISSLTLQIKQWKKTSTFIYKLGFGKPWLDEILFPPLRQALFVSSGFYSIKYMD
jgi:hypothetical protein